MIRILADGILVGYTNIAFWLLVPFCGALLAHVVWYFLMAFLEWRMPEKAKLKAAREADRLTILELKGQLCEYAIKSVELLESEARLRDVVEAMRSSNRNLNAAATEALRDQTK